MNAFLNMVLSSIQKCTFFTYWIDSFWNSIVSLENVWLQQLTCIKQLRLKCSLGSNPCICPFETFNNVKKTHPKPMCQFTKLEVDINDKLMGFIS